jgi:hypothetical protein
MPDGANAGDAKKDAAPAAPATPPADGKPVQPTATEQAKPDATKVEAKPADKAATLLAPEIKLTVPEGFDAKGIEDFAKKHSLSQEAAQALLDERVAERKAAAEAEQAKLAALPQQWLEQTKADKDIGGQNLPTTLANAQRVLSRFGTESFRNALNQTGLGNHPELVRFMAAIGRAMGEDRPLPTTAAPNAKRDPADVMFPTSAKG